MSVLQPFDVGADRSRACLDAAVIAVGDRLGGNGLARGVLQIGDDINMQPALIALQGERIVAPSSDDLPCNLALALERVGRNNGALEGKHSNSLGTAAILLDLASVAICASAIRWSRPQALTMCSADVSLAGSNERRSTLPSMAVTP